MSIKTKKLKYNKLIVSEKLYIGITDTINSFRSTLASCEELWSRPTLHQQEGLTQSRPSHSTHIDTKGRSCQWRHKQSYIRDPTHLPTTFCSSNAGRHIPGLPFIFDECGQDGRQWHSFSRHKRRSHCFQGRRRAHHMHGRTHPHWNTR